MLDFSLMLHVWVKLLVVDRIQAQCNKFVTGIENIATGNLKVTDSPGILVTYPKEYGLYGQELATRGRKDREIMGTDF